MRRIVLALLIACLPGLAVAEGSALRRLDTGDQTRGWEGVGRLEIGGRGFCTGALIAPNLVLTAAHCMYNRVTGETVDPADIEFRAGWRNGRASAYREVRRAAVHPDYRFDAPRQADKVQNDLALLELYHPIRNTTIVPFATASDLRRGEPVRVVSYAHDRADAPSMQDTCDVLGQQSGVFVMSCSVDFGSSGAPVFRVGASGVEIVTVVSAKADMQGMPVALGSVLKGQIDLLRAEISVAAGGGRKVTIRRADSAADRGSTGAKFVKP